MIAFLYTDMIYYLIGRLVCWFFSLIFLFFCFSDKFLTCECSLPFLDAVPLLLIRIRKSRLSGGYWLYKRYIKRGLDIFFSLLSLFFLSPVYLITAAAIRLESGSPVIFRQTRLGKDCREFCMYKFRSMAVDSEHTGSGVYSDRNDPRVTRVGRILRATSIDAPPPSYLSSLAGK